MFTAITVISTLTLLVSAYLAHHHFVRSRNYLKGTVYSALTAIAAVAAPSAYAHHAQSPEVYAIVSSYFGVLAVIGAAVFMTVMAAVVWLAFRLTFEETGVKQPA